MKTKTARVNGKPGYRTGSAWRRAGSRRSFTRATRTAPPLILKSILVPIDFSAESKKALAYARSFARLFGAEITLLHVVEPIPWTADYGYGEVHGVSPNEYLLKRGKTQLEGLRKQQMETSDECGMIVQSGKAFDEIVKAAKELSVDLIILTTRGYTGRDRALSGSAAERVVRDAPCPVLVVREQEHEFIGQTLNPKESL
jgi:nucleotide-binding universal stress UspA family protein